MSSHPTSHATTPRTTRRAVTTTRPRTEVNAARVLRRLALGACTTIALTAIAAAPAPAINQDHQDGTGVTVPIPSSNPLNCHNYPKDDPGCEVPSSGAAVGPGDGRQATSVALGALGGIALAGTGLAITLGVQQRREHPAPHTA